MRKNLSETSRTRIPCCCWFFSLSAIIKHRLMNELWMSYEWYNILKIVRQNVTKTNGADNLRNKSKGYRLCVLASGSLITAIFIFRTLIRVSCLHFGQYSGKFSSTVSSRIFNLVLLPQTGHNIHSLSHITSIPSYSSSCPVSHLLRKVYRSFNSCSNFL